MMRWATTASTKRRRVAGSEESLYAGASALLREQLRVSPAVSGVVDARGWAAVADSSGSVCVWDFAQPSTPHRSLELHALDGLALVGEYCMGVCGRRVTVASVAATGRFEADMELDLADDESVSVVKGKAIGTSEGAVWVWQPGTSTMAPLADVRDEAALAAQGPRLGLRGLFSARKARRAKPDVAALAWRDEMLAVVRKDGVVVLWTTSSKLAAICDCDENATDVVDAAWSVSALVCLQHRDGWRVVFLDVPVVVEATSARAARRSALAATRVVELDAPARAIGSLYALGDAGWLCLRDSTCVVAPIQGFKVGELRRTADPVALGPLAANALALVQPTGDVRVLHVAVAEDAAADDGSATAVWLARVKALLHDDDDAVAVVKDAASNEPADFAAAVVAVASDIVDALPDSGLSPHELSGDLALRALEVKHQTFGSFLARLGAVGATLPTASLAVLAGRLGAATSLARSHANAKHAGELLSSACKRAVAASPAFSGEEAMRGAGLSYLDLYYGRPSVEALGLALVDVEDAPTVIELASFAAQAGSDARAAAQQVGMNPRDEPDLADALRRAVNALTRLTPERKRKHLVAAPPEHLATQALDVTLKVCGLLLPNCGAEDADACVRAVLTAADALPLEDWQANTKEAFKVAQDLHRHDAFVDVCLRADDAAVGVVDSGVPGLASRRRRSWGRDRLAEACAQHPASVAPVALARLMDRGLVADAVQVAAVADLELPANLAWLKTGADVPRHPVLDPVAALAGETRDLHRLELRLACRFADPTAPTPVEDDPLLAALRLLRGAKDRDASLTLARLALAAAQGDDQKTARAWVAAAQVDAGAWNAALADADQAIDLDPRLRRTVFYDAVKLARTTSRPAADALVAQLNTDWADTTSNLHRCAALLHTAARLAAEDPYV